MKLPPAQEFLKYAFGISLVICSLALLVFSITNNVAKAAPPKAFANFQGVAPVVKGNSVYLIRYNVEGNFVTLFQTMTSIPLP